MKKNRKYLIALVLLTLITATTIVCAIALKTYAGPAATSHRNNDPANTQPEKGCVFRTVFGEEPSDSNFIYKTPAKALNSIEEALVWMAKAQLPDGGWGSGTHSRQQIRDPHAVKSDPASTAMVSMALLRCKNTPGSGKYSNNLNKAVNFLLLAVEHSGNEAKITSLTGTQPQIKLGSNIDVILTSQFLTNLLEVIDDNPDLKSRVVKCNNKCLAKIQKNQDKDGSTRGSGWAGVLQSSLATNALETAEEKGLEVDTVILENSKNFQKGNYNAKSGEVKTDKGAGVILYSVSGASRSSAKEAKHAKQMVETAKKEGKLTNEEKVDAPTLEKLGFSKSDANKYSTAYEINESSKVRAQDNQVMDGFGSNGGEEFLSYLQTGEGMIVSKDSEWKKWYDNISGRLLKIQNSDGSWSGHHCITSPVFCTATCLLILSVNNDIESLVRL